MAILLHPDKSLAPGAEEAFKLLTIARSQLLRYANWKLYKNQGSQDRLRCLRPDLKRNSIGLFLFHALQFNPINLNAFKLFYIIFYKLLGFLTSLFLECYDVGLHEFSANQIGFISLEKLSMKKKFKKFHKMKLNFQWQKSREMFSNMISPL